MNFRKTIDNMIEAEEILEKEFERISALKKYDEYEKHLLCQMRHYSDKIAIMSALMYALKELKKMEISPVDCSPEITISDDEFDIEDWYEMADPEKSLNIDRETYREKFEPKLEAIYVWDKSHTQIDGFQYAKSLYLSRA